MKTIIYLLTSIVLLSTNAFSQQTNYKVLLQSGTFIPEANANNYTNQQYLTASEAVGGFLFQLFQFYDIPNHYQRKAMENTGVRFLEYLPHNTYVVAYPKDLPLEEVASWNLRSILPIRPEYKIDRTLIEHPYGEWAVRGDQIMVILQYYNNISMDVAKAECLTRGFTVSDENPITHSLKIWVPQNKISKIAALPFVRYISLVPAPPQPEDEPAATQQRSNIVASAVGNYGFDGTGVNVCVREDFTISSHIDFQGRVNNDINEFGFTNLESSHTHQVAGVLGGAGNLDPRTAGAAPGISIYSLEAYNDFSGGEELLHTQEEVVITTTSLGDGCNAGYTQAALAVDLLSNTHPRFLHVFSCGNANDDGNDCGYGAGPNWGNITGGNKQGKNCIASAMLTTTGNLHIASSRGPAQDGRIKPDLSTVGFATAPSLNNTYLSNWGTSFASPGVAGAAAQLVQAYRTWNNGENPDAALVKAALLNTAIDLGTTGPDFSHGWGQVNTLRAVQLLEENRYTSVEIDQGQTQQITIDIPSDIEEARIMIYWNDPAAAAGTLTALVNDVNMLLTTPGGIELLPLVLDHTPNEATLGNPAVPGIDNLNNVEQVRVTPPQAGSYTLTISGDAIPMGPQKVFVLYEFINKDITLTHPFGGESFAPEEETMILWDAHGDEGLFLIEYSSDGGASWETVAEVSGSLRTHSWEIPSTITGDGRIRISRDGMEATGVDFSVLESPTNMEVTQACVDFLQVSWDSVPEATAYAVYLLGEKYMEAVDTTTANSYMLSIDNPTENNWLSVSALGENGAESRRAIAIPYNSGLLDCDYDTDMAILELSSYCSENHLSCTDGADPIQIQIQNTGLLAQSDPSLSYQVNAEPVVTETFTGSLAPGAFAEYSFVAIPQLVEGQNLIRVWSNLPGDEVFFNDTIALGLDVTYLETLPQQTPEEEDFQSAVFPPVGWQSIDYDSLIGWATASVTGPDGDITQVAFMENYNNFNMGQRDLLLTSPIDLSGTTSPKLVFDLSYARYNTDYADTFKIFVNTICSADCSQTEVYNKFSQNLATAGESVNPFTPNSANQWRKEVIDLSDFAGQTIYVTFENTTGYGNNLYLDNIAFADFEPPNAGFTYTDLENGVVDFNNTSTGTASFLWDFGNGETSSEEHPQTTYTTTGSYTVTLTAFNDWCVDESTQTINIIITGSHELSSLSEVKLAPNPGSGYCRLSFTDKETGTYHWEWTNAMGQSTQSGLINSHPGTNQLEWDLSNWPTGVYWLWLVDEAQRQTVIRWVKQ